MAVTINDVAKRARVSSTAVSLAFRKGSRISEPTRARVLAAARELGYTPNRFAAGLRLGKSQLIGLIVTELDNPFITGIVSSVERIAASRGYNVTVFGTFRDIDVEKQSVRTCLGLHVEGLIVAACEEENEILLQLNRENFPMVFLDSVPGGGIDCSYVANDMEAVGRVGTEYLLGLGHRRILHISGPEEHKTFSSFSRCLEGYKQALDANGVTFDPDLVICSGVYIEAGRTAVEQALERNTDFSAVFAINDMAALGAMDSLEKHGLKVPDDVSVLGVDHIEVGSLGRIGLATIETPNSTMGDVGANMLMEMLDAGAADPNNVKRVVLPPTLIVGNSVCAYAGRGTSSRRPSGA